MMELPQRDPGARLRAHFERLSEVLASVATSPALPESFATDVETMRRIADRLRDWVDEPC